jgi:hypothetical protein
MKKMTNQRDFPYFPSNEEIKQKGEILIWGEDGEIEDYVLLDIKSRCVYNFDEVAGGRRFVFCIDEDWGVSSAWMYRDHMNTWVPASVLQFIKVLDEFLSQIREQYEDRESND